MKRLLCLLLALCIVPVVNVAAASSLDFKDVAKNHWAYENITEGVKKGYFAGFSDGKFKPESNVTRAEAIKVLTAFLGRTTAKPTKSEFTDVDVNAWYAPYVNVSDYMFPEKWLDEKLFKPNAKITREEVVFAIVTAMQYDYKIDRADLSYLKSFKDKEKIGFGLEDYMAIALEFGVISGYPDKTIRPGANITRAEFASLMSRVSEQKAILDGRRQAVVDYMDTQIGLLWTTDEDLTYALDSSGLPPEKLTGKTLITYKKGRIYQGVPYSYAAGDMGAFLDYSSGQDEKGVHKISGVSWKDFSTAGGSTPRTARLGNDCGASVQLALGSIGHNVSISGVTKLAPYHGYPKVGKYEGNDLYNYDLATKSNSTEVMYKAYSQMQEGDLLVKYDAKTDGAHVKMVVGVEVAYDENGNIDPKNSILITHEQTKVNLLNEKKYYNEEIGSDVYYVGGYAASLSFERWYANAYHPVTAEILVNPAPIEKPVITDSVTEHNLDTLFTGKIKSTWTVAYATIDITDASGKIVQTSSILPVRSAEVQYFSSFTINMKNFKTNEGGLIRGKIEPDKLPSGNYKCTVTLRLVNGETFKVREFDFKK